MSSEPRLTQFVKNTLKSGARRGKRRLSALLRPLPGRKLPRELKAGRVGRLARRLPLGLRDPGFADLLRRIDEDGRIHYHTDVTLYFDGTETLDAMLAAITAAEREVLVEAYIFEDDASGRLFLDALAAAAQRGVEVKVLADAYGSFWTRREFWQEMRDAGIVVKLFHPLLSKLWWHAFRDHRKVIVTDRRVAFTGGMNIADEYLSSERRARHEQWRDTHLRLIGPASEEMAGVFEESWEQVSGETLPTWPDEDPASTTPASKTTDAAILVLESRPLRGHHETASALAAIVEAARETVWLTNAYFAPNRLAVRILERAALRGVDVRLLLPGQTDVPLVRHAGHGFFSRLLKHGVRVFEYQPSVLHAKSLVADGQVAVVGSSNLDLRSFRYNAECNLVLLDKDLAGQLQRQFLADLEHSEEILLDAWRQRTWMHRLGDSLARKLGPFL